MLKANYFDKYNNSKGALHVDLATSRNKRARGNYTHPSISSLMDTTLYFI